MVIHPSKELVRARAPFSHFVSKRARISSIALEFRRRSGDTASSASARSSLRLAGEGDHDTDDDVSALAASPAPSDDPSAEGVAFVPEALWARLLVKCSQCAAAL